MKHLHPARSGTIVFFIFLSLFFISCDPTEDPALTYPTTFRYDKLVFNPSKFYVLTGTAYTEIQPVGNYAVFDSLFKDAGFLEITETEFPIEKMDLISETKANVHFFTYLNYPVEALLANYSFDVATGNFVIEGITDTFTIEPAVDYNTVNFPLYTTQYAHNTGSGTDYAPFYTRYGKPDVPALIASLRQKWSLLAGDTVAVNLSGYLYVKE
jgi:hypothetical protein